MSALHGNGRLVRRHFGRMAKAVAFDSHFVGAREILADTPGRSPVARGHGDDDEDDDDDDDDNDDEEDDDDDDSGDPNGDDNDVSPSGSSTSESSTSVDRSAVTPTSSSNWVSTPAALPTVYSVQTVYSADTTYSPGTANNAGTAYSPSTTNSAGNTYSSSSSSSSSALMVHQSTLSIPPHTEVTQSWDAQSTDTMSSATESPTSAPSSSSSSSATTVGVITGLLSVVVLICVTMFVLRRRRKNPEAGDGFNADVFKRQSSAVLIDNEPARPSRNAPAGFDARPPSMVERNVKNARLASRPPSEIPPVPSLLQYRNTDAIDYFAASKPLQSHMFALPSEAEVDSVSVHDHSRVTSLNPSDSMYNEDGHLEKQLSDGNLSRQNSISGGVCPAEAQAMVQAEPLAEVLAEVFAEVQAEPQAEVQAKPQAEVQAEPQAEVQAEPQAEVQAEPQVEIQAEVQAKSQVEPQAEVQTQPQTAEVQGEVQVKVQAEVQAEMGRGSMIQHDVKNVGLPSRPPSEMPPVPRLRNMGAIDYLAASKPLQSRMFTLPTEAEVDSFFVHGHSRVTSINPFDSMYDEDGHFEKQPSDGNLLKRNSISGQAEPQTEVQVEPQAEPQGEVQAGGQAEEQVELPAETVAAGQAEGQTEVQAEVVAEVQAEGQAEVQTEAPAEEQAEVQVEAPTEGQAKVQTEAVAEVQVEEQAEADAVAEVQAEGQTEVHAEVVAGLQAEGQQAEPQVEVQAEAQAEPQAEVQGGRQAEVQVEMSKGSMMPTLAAQYAEVAKHLSIISQRYSNVINKDGEQVYQVTGHAISPEDDATELDDPFADPFEAQAAQDRRPSFLTVSTTLSTPDPTLVADLQDRPLDQRPVTLAYTEYDVIDAYGGM